MLYICRFQTVCNEEFLHDLRSFLEHFYTDINTIRTNIVTLIATLILDPADSLERLTNILLNDITNVIVNTQSVSVANVHSTHNHVANDNTGDNSEGSMLSMYIRTIKSLEHLVTTVNCVLRHR